MCSCNASFTRSMYSQSRKVRSTTRFLLFGVVSICTFMLFSLRLPVHSGTKMPTSARRKGSPHPICSDSFYIPSKLGRKGLCYVRKPQGYQLPFGSEKRLWSVPLNNLGHLNYSHPNYSLQVEEQRWARIAGDTMILNPEGGTSVRAFGDNYAYARFLMKHSEAQERFRNVSKAVILDTGAGIGSVAGAMADPFGGNKSLEVLSYVPVESYLRLGAVIADRGLPIFIQYFDGGPLPFPSESFDVVHCRWCWHHQAGYDVWLDEVNRLLIPGGTFIFTFVPVRDEALLPRNQWNEALAKQPWKCKLHHRISTVCKKRKSKEKIPCSLQESKEERINALPRQRVLRAGISRVMDNIRKQAEAPDAVDRALNLNCPPNADCWETENLFKVPYTLHTFSPRHNDTLQRYIQAGSVGMLHDWMESGPFYPRMFDMVHLACDKSSKRLLTLRDTYVEMHRLLRPRGFLIILQATCPYTKDSVSLLEGSNFEVIMHYNSNVVARRLDV